jgi:hypothetical protein
MASRALSVAAGLPLAASGTGGQIVKVVFAVMAGRCGAAPFEPFSASLIVHDVKEVAARRLHPRELQVRMIGRKNEDACQSE